MSGVLRISVLVVVCWPATATIWLWNISCKNR